MDVNALTTAISSLGFPIVMCGGMFWYMMKEKEVSALYQKKMEEDIRCPLEYGLSVFGGKWKSRIICVLAAKNGVTVPFL